MCLVTKIVTEMYCVVGRGNITSEHAGPNLTTGSTFCWQIYCHLCSHRTMHAGVLAVTANRALGPTRVLAVTANAAPLTHTGVLAWTAVNAATEPTRILALTGSVAPLIHTVVLAVTASGAPLTCTGVLAVTAS